MAKDAYIKFRCSEDFKKMVEDRAYMYGKNVTDYIEYLIRKDTDDMRVIMNDVSEECLKELEKESSCYLSKIDGEWWLFTDMNFFNYISHKYKFEKPLDGYDNPRVESYSLEGYCSIKYDCEEFDYFGLYYSLLEYSKTTLDTVNLEIEQGEFKFENWDVEIDEDIKVGIMTQASFELEKQLKEMYKNGYDLSILDMSIRTMQLNNENKEKEGLS